MAEGSSVGEGGISRIDVRRTAQNAAGDDCVTAYFLGKPRLLAGLEEQVKREKKMNERSRSAYIEGLKRYQEKGVRVLIDGRDADDSLWGKLFEPRKDGGFYMGDYILEDIPETEAEQLRDPRELYGGFAGGTGKKRLKEIRFDVVYHVKR